MKPKRGARSRKTRRGGKIGGKKRVGKKTVPEIGNRSKKHGKQTLEAHLIGRNLLQLPRINLTDVIRTPPRGWVEVWEYEESHDGDEGDDRDQPEVNRTEPTEVNGTEPTEVNGTEPTEVNGTEPTEVNGTEPTEVNGTGPTETHEVPTPEFHQFSTGDFLITEESLQRQSEMLDVILQGGQGEDGSIAGEMDDFSLPGEDYDDDDMTAPSSGSEWEWTHGGARPTAILNDKKTTIGQPGQSAGVDSDESPSTQPIPTTQGLHNPSAKKGTELSPTRIFYNPTTFGAISHLATICSQSPALCSHVHDLQLLVKSFQRKYQQFTMTNPKGQTGLTLAQQRRIEELNVEILKAAAAVTTTKRSRRVRINDDVEIYGG